MSAPGQLEEARVARREGDSVATAATLIVIPTYNERENVGRMCEELVRLGLDADICFIDDGSPDGTGTLLDELATVHQRVSVLHRGGKTGIGSAHQAGIALAYNGGYQTLITLDCDFTHSPLDIPRLMEAAEREDADVVVGSRYMAAGSLPGWNPMRRFLTMLGHFLTTTMLELPEDASGAFRLYRLDRVPRALFERVRSRSYAFFFESLFVLGRNGFRIAEIPIVLPARTYGHSKMTLTDAARSLRTLIEVFWESVRKPERFVVPRAMPALDPALRDPQGWDAYWGNKATPGGSAYEAIATLYRRLIIKRNLDRAILSVFPRNSLLLHAGCGSGQVDVYLQRVMQLTALDISEGALRLYVRNNARVRDVRHGSILALPFDNETFDGVYNLGVVEHFEGADLQKIFDEFHRVLRPRGRVVIFWPHRRATSVLVLRIVHFLKQRIFRSPAAFHPPEVSLLAGPEEARRVLEKSGFRLVRYDFGPRDFWVQAVVVGERA